ncbi:MAG: hypothetical protein R3F40_10355 [Candidatus Competibacteraceae bacterium]
MSDADERQRVRDNLERLAREGVGELRCWRTLSGLRRVGDERSRALLERLASDPYENGTARQRAAIELGELGHSISESVLESLLHQRRRSAQGGSGGVAADRLIPMMPLRSTYWL